MTEALPCSCTHTFALHPFGGACLSPGCNCQGYCACLDLEKASWEEIKKAAMESPWIPPQYYQNDWVSDVCSFLRGTSPDDELRKEWSRLSMGPSSLPVPDTHIRPLLLYLLHQLRKGQIPDPQVVGTAMEGKPLPPCGHLGCIWEAEHVH